MGELHIAMPDLDRLEFVVYFIKYNSFKDDFYYKQVEDLFNKELEKTQ